MIYTNIMLAVLCAPSNGSKRAIQKRAVLATMDDFLKNLNDEAKFVQTDIDDESHNKFTFVLPPSDQTEEKSAVDEAPRGPEWDDNIAALKKCGEVAGLNEGLFWRELPEHEIPIYRVFLKDRDPGQKLFVKREKGGDKVKFHVVAWRIDDAHKVPTLVIVVCVTGDTTAKTFDPTKPMVFYRGIIPADSFAVKERTKKCGAEKYAIKFQRRVGMKRFEEEDFYLTGLAKATDKTETGKDGIAKLKQVVEALKIDQGGFVRDTTAKKNVQNKHLKNWLDKDMWSDQLYKPAFQDGTFSTGRRMTSCTMGSGHPLLKAEPSQVSMTLPKLKLVASLSAYDEFDLIFEADLTVD